ncbi:U-box domain-containing protein 34 [Glycine soja]|uniref:RING-type E3 ubiquitin transferase n=1 Tax=Glycine soja TaxID=3848 RepID=A0A0B2PG83_GLYSO|nr:U-box domain-containing protein 34 [Glycine soja]
MQEEVERLQLELQNTITMYKQVCGELVQAQNENKFSKESYERQMAELDVLKESIEKQRIVDTLLSNDRRYRKYTMDEIKLATNFFAEDLIIGEGGYGKVYKCNLDHSPVAVKVLHQDAINKKDEFLKEVEILSQLHHPNMVLLFGACPESGCLVYEYKENGKPIVHRDIKPGNVLLDRNYVSKIADIGLAKLLVEVVPDNVTEYRESILAGTLHYMDPEYQRTGTVRPKSDVYAFGVITLQLITGRHARGLIVTVELAQVALKCSALRCRDRPEIDTEVLPVLERFSDAANSSTRMGINSVSVPSQYYCPILQEIMDDPYIAADGFTYEYIAIKAWLSKHNVSPMTKLKLQYSVLTPNHTLRSAIQEWKSGVTF